MPTSWPALNWTSTGRAKCARQRRPRPATQTRSGVAGTPASGSGCCEYRCCVCGFDLRIGLTPAGLEAAHIQWHHVGGPDIEPNGLSLCALHHKLFDLGAFTVEPSEHRVVFSQHAISGGRGMTGELQFHGRTILPPQHADLPPAPEFLAWNVQNVFKALARQAPAATPRATR